MRHESPGEVDRGGEKETAAQEIKEKLSIIPKRTCRWAMHK